LTHISEDEVLLKIFNESKNKYDIFTRIASELFDKKEEKIVSKERDFAKKISYGIIYGMGYHFILYKRYKALAKETEMTEDDSKLYISKFKKKFNKAFIKSVDCTKKCEIKGYVETIYGRKRFIHDINSHDSFKKSSAERQAFNTICQGNFYFNN
jgi:DNA polymerase I